MKTRATLSIVFVLAASIAMSSDAADLPETSIYHLDVSLTDQQAIEQSLGVFRGHPVVVSMFYATCPNVCPVLISTIQRMERVIAADELADLRVLLVSVDPINDTPSVLQQVATRHNVDSDRWKLTRAAASDVRKIAAVLRVRYRELPDGQFNHTSVLTLVDGDGVIQAQSAKIPGIDEAFLRAIEEQF